MKASAVKSATVTTSTVVDIDDFGFDADDLNKASGAIVTAVTSDCMATWAGVDPTATLGHRLVASRRFDPGGRLELSSNSDVKNLRFLALIASATVTITLVE